MIIHSEVKDTKHTEIQERFIQLRASGMAYSAISAELGISKGTCSNWGKKYAAEIEQAKSQPLQRANKKKPRVVDITDKLTLEPGSGKLPIAHYMTDEFKERYERGELTPEEAEGVEIIERTGREIGELFKNMTFELPPINMPDSNILGKVFREISLPHIDAGLIDEVNKAAQDILNQFKPIFADLQERFEEYIESLPPDEQAEIRAEIEAAKAKQGKTGESETEPRSGNDAAEITTATVSNMILDTVYAAALSGTATSQLATINTNVNKPDVDPVSGTATLKRGNFSLTIENYGNTAREFKVSTNKLISICTILLAHQNNYRERNSEAIKPTVTFTVDEYMKLLGITPNQKGRDKARAKIRSDIDTLLNTRISWIEKRKGKAVKNGDFISIPIIGGRTGIYKGNVVVTFSKEMAEYLVQHAYLMQYSLELLKIDERNANVYPLGYQLLMHASIDNNLKKGTAKIISVKKALEYCPNIPKYEALIEYDRHWERKIKDTLEKALDKLDFILRWEYCNSKHEPLTDEQLRQICTDYYSFIGLYIYYELPDAPDQTERLTAKAERKTKRAKKKNANKKEESEPRSERG